MRWLALILLLPTGALADDALTVGVYAPRVFFGNSLARGNYAKSVAQQLAAKTGLEFAAAHSPAAVSSAAR